jgi:cell division GTPase FtsZ
MQQQPVIRIIGVGEVGIRVINRLVHYDNDHIALCLALAADEATLYDAQIPIRVLASVTPMTTEITTHLHDTQLVFVIVDYQLAAELHLAHQAIVSIHQLGIPTIALVSKINKRQQYKQGGLHDSMRIFTQRRTVAQDAALALLQQAATGVFELDHLQNGLNFPLPQTKYQPPAAITYAHSIMSNILKILHDPGLITIDMTDFIALFHESSEIGLIKTYIGSGIDIKQQIVKALQENQSLIEKHTRFILNLYSSESLKLFEISMIADAIEQICGAQSSITWGLFIDTFYPEDYLQIDLFAV